MMKRTLLLVFIHGFKGGDDTFARFPPHLRALLSHSLPQLEIVQLQYPKFDTRGELGTCVSNFKEWLQNKVIDLEVANGTPSPVIDPQTRVILIGHSMGGIVAAETIRDIAGETPIPHHSPSSSTTEEDGPATPFMFPSIIGVMAFDTPYFGISPGVLAHNAESHYQTARSAWTAYNSLTGALGLAGGSSPNTPPAEAPKAPKAPATPVAIAAAPSASDPDTATVPAWQRWGRYAMYAGAAGAVLAGGAAAYANRSTIGEGWTWASSHLEFVGTLARGAELETRVAEMIKLSESRGLGFRNLFTQLGSGAATLTWNDEDQGGEGWAHTVLGSQRTFCNLPKSESTRRYFEATVNEKASNEVCAHMSMFTPRENPGYYGMSERAKEIVTEWVTHAWPDVERASTESGAEEDDAEIVYKEEVDI